MRLWTPGWLLTVPGPTVLDDRITARHSPARPHSSHCPLGCAQELKCATVGRERGGSAQRRGADSRGASRGPSVPWSIPKAQGALGGGQAPPRPGHSFPLVSAPLLFFLPVHGLTNGGGNWVSFVCHSVSFKLSFYLLYIYQVLNT